LNHARDTGSGVAVGQESVAVSKPLTENDSRSGVYNLAGLRGEMGARSAIFLFHRQTPDVLPLRPFRLCGVLLPGEFRQHRRDRTASEGRGQGTEPGPPGHKSIVRGGTRHSRRLGNGRKITSALAFRPLTPTLSPGYRGEGVIFRLRLHPAGAGSRWSNCWW
jgi:hypothetical protein